MRRGTRSEAGFPRRWAESWVGFVGEREGWENPGKDKQLSAKRAELLLSNSILHASSQHLALTDT